MFWERHRRRVHCLECRVEVTAGLLLLHHQIHNRVSWGDHPPPLPPPPRVEAQTYRVSLPKRLLRLRCLVEGCLGWDSNRTNLQVHFAHCHVQDTILILYEGNRPYPLCPKCNMFVSHKALNGRHIAF